MRTFCVTEAASALLAKNIGKPLPRLESLIQTPEIRTS